MICILLKGITAPPILASENRTRFRRFHVPSQDVGTGAGRPLTSVNHTNYNSTKNATPESKASSLFKIKYFRLSAVDKETKINHLPPASYSAITKYSDHALLMKFNTSTSLPLNHVWLKQAIQISLYANSLHKLPKSQRDTIPPGFREVRSYVARLSHRENSKMKKPEVLERAQIASKQRDPINYRSHCMTHNNYAGGNRS
jgi:hypothetical protein